MVQPLALTKPKFICNLTVPVLQIWKLRLGGRKGLAPSHLGKLDKLPGGDAPQMEQPIYSLHKLTVRMGGAGGGLASPY